MGEIKAGFIRKAEEKQETEHKQKPRNKQETANKQNARGRQKNEFALLAQVKMFSPDQKKFLLSQIVSSTYNNIISGVLMTGFLLYIGVENAGIGVILSIPLLANVLQIPFSKIWSCFRDAKKAINRMVLVTRLMILSIILIPLLIPDHADNLSCIQLPLKVALACVILCVAYIFASSSGIQLNYWMVNSINANIQGTFFAFRDRIVVVFTTLIAFSASRLVDVLKSTGQEYAGFAAAFFVAAVIAVLDFNIIKKITYHAVPGERSRILWKEYLQVFLEDKRYVFFVIYMFSLNLSINIANPYYNAYMVNELHLNFTKVMMLTTIQIVIQILVSSIWGKAANHTPWKYILLYVSAGLGIQFLIWPFVTAESIGLILVIFITSGIMSTGLVTSQFMVPYAYIKQDKAVIYLSMTTGITACGGFLGSMIGSGIIASLSPVKVQVFSVEFGSMQINMIISGLLILCTVFYSKAVLKTS